VRVVSLAPSLNLRDQIGTGQSSSSRRLLSSVQLAAYGCGGEFFIARNPDPASTLLAAMSGVSHAAVVVDDRYSSLFKLATFVQRRSQSRLWKRPCGIPRCRSCSRKTRRLAQEWSYRFFGVAIENRANEAVGAARFDAPLTPGRSHQYW
jgi:hypothetical protein